MFHCSVAPVVGLRAARWFWELPLTWVKLPPAIRRLPATSFSDRTWSFAEGAHEQERPVVDGDGGEIRPRAAIDGCERAAHEQRVVLPRQREHLTARRRGPGGHERPCPGCDGREPLSACAAHVRERPAQIHRRADHPDRPDGAVGIRIPGQERTGREADRSDVVSCHLARAGRIAGGPQRCELTAEIHRRARHDDRVHTAVRLPGGHRMHPHRSRLCHSRCT